MAACTPSIHVFLERPLFLLSSGIHSIINFGVLSSGIRFTWSYHCSHSSQWCLWCPASLTPPLFPLYVYSLFFPSLIFFPSDSYFQKFRSQKYWSWDSKFTSSANSWGCQLPGASVDVTCVVALCRLRENPAVLALSLRVPDGVPDSRGAASCLLSHLHFLPGCST
jgi:hypothetical protein